MRLLNAIVNGWFLKDIKRLVVENFKKDDGPIVVLTKASKFGGQLRYGKGDKGIKGNRYVPRVGHLAKAGFIITN